MVTELNVAMGKQTFALNGDVCCAALRLQPAGVKAFKYRTKGVAPALTVVIASQR